MANQRISKDKRVFILAMLTEGTPINAVCRITKTGKHAVLRVIRETGEALNAYMRDNFLNISCQRLAMDEQWQYVGCHGQRMARKEDERGDFWLWCAIDSDTKLVISHFVASRGATDCQDFVADVAKRITGPVQIASDSHHSYYFAVHGAFHGREYSYGTETKVFRQSDEWNPKAGDRRRLNGIPRIAKAKREAVFGAPDLSTLTTSHVERCFGSVRQELSRFTRCTLAYSKSLQMHKLAVALPFGIYNFVRKHTSLGRQTPAQAAGLAEQAWSFEDVVDMSDRYWQPKQEAERAVKAAARRAAEDAMFEAALS